MSIFLISVGSCERNVTLMVSQWNYNDLEHYLSKHDSSIYVSCQINSLDPGRFESNFRMVIFNLILEIGG